MYVVTTANYEDLTTEEKEEIPNSGSGKEYANYLVVTTDHGRRVFSDAMEPEDCVFYRDLGWIESELGLAYKQGLKDSNPSR
ncbi:hypothetical protein KAR91_62265 [Candidatus Pacearchaeota archaeon]|nr:hypothetical protein [Candidatus Pacearchaeota archaeon]